MKSVCRLHQDEVSDGLYPISRKQMVRVSQKKSAVNGTCIDRIIVDVVTHMMKDILKSKRKHA